MNKKIILIILIISILLFGIWYLFFNKTTNFLSNPIPKSQKTVQPSETLTDYIDESGFSFSYPDNLSISKNEVDDAAYADLALSSKEVNGSLSLRITDSKFKALDEWVKLNQKAAVGEPKIVKLGNLNGMEIKTADRLLFGALDQGIFFSIEIPLVEQDFWMKVYSKLLADFSFVSPASVEAQTGSSSNDVFFEGEEVIQ